MGIWHLTKSFNSHNTHQKSYRQTWSLHSEKQNDWQTIISQKFRGGQKFRLTRHPQSLFNFDSSRSLRGDFLSKNIGTISVGSMVPGVWTGVGFLNLKNFQTWTRIQKCWNRSGVGVWKSDSSHLCCKPNHKMTSEKIVSFLRTVASQLSVVNEKPNLNSTKIRGGGDWDDRPT